MKPPLLNYSTNIPGAEYIFSKWSKGGDSWEGEGTTPVGPEVALKSITFTVPKTTPAGTYRIHGGYLDVTHRSGGYDWLDVYAKFYQMEISDLTITVLKGDIETVEDLIDAIGANVTLDSEAAITAAKGGHSVTLLERQARVGRKLLSTGNGRCNLTNLNMGLPYYHGQDAAFIRPAFEALSLDATLDFFHGLGLLTTAEDNGRVYPYSDQAGSVVDVLRFAADAAGVTTRAGFEVTGLKKTKRGFTVLSAEETLPADRVIVCCGGMAGGKLGGTRSGYELLQSLGHSVTKLYPALVQIKTDNAFVKALKGVRANADLRLCRNRDAVAASRGEVQFTDFGVSGPAVFELSRAAATEKGPLTLHIDLLPQLSTPEIEELLRRRLSSMPELTTENLLAGVLHNRLGRTVLRYAGYGLTDPVASLSPADLRKIAGAAKDFALPVVSVLGFDGAQVTAGGIRTAEFDSKTLQSRLVPGLYAAGEVLDIDGDCGGYNLQWAWSSGYLAGLLKSGT